MQLALFHSPLVGPTTWRWVADSDRSSRRWHDRTFTDQHRGEAFGREQQLLPLAELHLLANEIRSHLP